MTILKFKTNINCGSCINSVTPFLNEVDNLDEWKVDTSSPDKILEASLEDDNAQTVIQAVTKAGFEIEPME